MIRANFFQEAGEIEVNIIGPENVINLMQYRREMKITVFYDIFDILLIYSENHPTFIRQDPTSMSVVSDEIEKLLDFPFGSPRPLSQVRTDRKPTQCRFLADECWMLSAEYQQYTQNVVKNQNLIFCRTVKRHRIGQPLGETPAIGLQQ